MMKKYKQKIISSLIVNFIRRGVITLFFVHGVLAEGPSSFPVIGEVVRLDPGLDKIIPPDAKIEVIASGFEWTEGTVWVRDNNESYLLFSDIPRNAVYKWVDGEGISLYLTPSGYTGVSDYGGEPGSNGLLMDALGRLVSFEHGDRRVSRMEKDGGKITLADNYQGKRFNSPNDGVFMSNGDLYFTDPPYGLPKWFEDPRRELEFCGVYRLSPEGSLTLLTDKMTRPNGIGLSPDEKTLYVSQSDSDAPLWMKFPIKKNGTLGKGEVFFDATASVGVLPGHPDGMAIDRDGNIFATGPGGVYVFTPDGVLLGRLSTGERTANCTFGFDGSVLYIASDMYVCRIQTMTKGLGW
jgi:gluconolactonase